MPEFVFTQPTFSCVLRGSGMLKDGNPSNNIQDAEKLILAWQNFLHSFQKQKSQDLFVFSQRATTKRSFDTWVYCFMSYPRRNDKCYTMPTQLILNSPSCMRYYCQSIRRHQLLHVTSHRQLLLGRTEKFVPFLPPIQPGFEANTCYSSCPAGHFISLHASAGEWPSHIFSKRASFS